MKRNRTSCPLVTFIFQGFGISRHEFATSIAISNELQTSILASRFIRWEGTFGFQRAENGRQCIGTPVEAEMTLPVIHKL